MIQIRPGDFVAVSRGEFVVLFAILTKQVLFGGHWSYVFHGARPLTDMWSSEASGAGFQAAVDFIVPKRENRITRISRGNDFSSLMGPEWLQTQPHEGEVDYRIWRWMDGRRQEAELIRVTPSPSAEERSAPHYSCISADWACRLAARRWEPHMSKLAALHEN